MTALDVLIYLSMVAYAIAAIWAVRLVWHVAYAFALALSWLRWMLTLLRIHEVRYRLRYVLRDALRHWRHFAQRDYRPLLLVPGHGYWFGIGKWGVFPKSC